MFTGLVEARVAVSALDRAGAGARLSLPAPELPAEAPPWTPSVGESLAVSGCCLTVVRVESGGGTVFDLSAETLERTRFGSLEPGALVNLERSLVLGDRLGGHLVSGHVDAVGTISGIEDPGDGGRLFRFEVPHGFERYLIEKGSVCVDGISLTVVAPHGRTFAVAVIPETLLRTSLGEARTGDPVHLEADMVGKWIEKLVPGTARAPAMREDG